MRVSVRQPSALDVVTLVLVVLAIALRVTGANTLAFLCLAMMALLSPRHVIRALFLAWLFQMLNPGLVAKGDGGAVARYLMLFSAAGSVLIRSRLVRGTGGANPLILFTMGLGLFFILHGLIFSPFVDVTILRAILWTVAMSTCAGAWMLLTPEARVRMANEIFWFLVAVLVLSIPLLPTSVGRLVNDTGFQGITNGPQGYGMVMALLGAWAAGRMLGERKPPWHLLAIVMGSLAMIVLSETRTAGLAMLLGIAAAIVVAPILAGRPTREVVPGLRSKRVALVGVGLAIALLAAAPFIATLASTFITKSDRAQVGSLLEAYDVSRGGLIRTMLDNIKRDPMGGIGFGIASDPRFMSIERDEVLGLPTGAPMEKGVTPIAVLEEVGIPGFLLIVVWLFVLMRMAAKAGLAGLTVFVTIMLLNMGEATLFSASGFGLVTFILLFWAATTRPLLPNTGKSVR